MNMWFWKRKNRIFKIQTSASDDGWEAWTLEQLPPAKEVIHDGPSVTFGDLEEVRLIFGTITIGEVRIHISFARLYGEQDNSVCLIFEQGDQRISTHGILRKGTAIAILTDREGGFCELSGTMPDDLYSWLRECEKSMIWT